MATLHLGSSPHSTMLLHALALSQEARVEAVVDGGEVVQLPRHLLLLFSPLLRTLLSSLPAPPLLHLPEMASAPLLALEQLLSTGSTSMECPVTHITSAALALGIPIKDFTILPTSTSSTSTSMEGLSPLPKHPLQVNQPGTNTDQAINTPSDAIEHSGFEDDFEDVNETMSGNDDFGDVNEALEKEMKTEPTDSPSISSLANSPPSPTPTSSPHPTSPYSALPPTSSPLPTSPYSALPPTPSPTSHPPTTPPTDLSLTELYSSMVEEEDSSMDSIFEDVTEDVHTDDGDDFKETHRALEEEDAHAKETKSNEPTHTDEGSSPAVGMDAEEIEFEDVNDDVEADDGFEDTLKALEEEDKKERGTQGNESTDTEKAINTELIDDCDYVKADCNVQALEDEDKEQTFGDDVDTKSMKEMTLEETDITEKAKQPNVNIVVQNVMKSINDVLGKEQNNIVGTKKQRLTKGRKYQHEKKKSPLKVKMHFNKNKQKRNSDDAFSDVFDECITKETTNNEEVDNKNTEDDEIEDAVYKGMCINVSQPLDIEFQSEDSTSYNEAEEPVSEDVKTAQICESEKEKDTSLNGRIIETKLKKIERATRKCRQIKPIVQETFVEETKLSSKPNKRTWKKELGQLLKSVMEENNPVETLTNEKHEFMHVLKLKPSNNINTDVAQKACKETKEENLTKKINKTKKVPNKEITKINSKRKEADTRLETTSLLMSPNKRLKTNTNKTESKQECGTLIEEDEESQLEGFDDYEKVDPKLTISLNETPIEEDEDSEQEDSKLMNVTENEFEKQFKKEAENVKKIKVEEQIIELPDIMTIEEIDLEEFDTELSPLHPPKETKKPTKMCKCNFEEVVISKKAKKSGTLNRELRCQAFKCGKYFHCKAAVKSHFSQQHLSWDDL